MLIFLFDHLMKKVHDMNAVIWAMNLLSTRVSEISIFIWKYDISDLNSICVKLLQSLIDNIALLISITNIAVAQIISIK